MRFSIVIPTFQRREIVVRMVSALQRQQGDFEVIVVIDGSTDGTADALRALQLPFPLTVIEQQNGGAAQARNVAANAATGELLLFLDDDMEADPEMLVQHDLSHREGADIVFGHLPLHPDSPDNLLSRGVGRWAERRREQLAAPDTDVPVTDLNTGQMSISREDFQRLGGFDTSFTREGLYGGEDFEFGHRAHKAGLRAAFNPVAISHQFYAVDPADYTRRTRESARSHEELNAKHPELMQDFSAGREFTSRRSRIIFGALSMAPPVLSWPLRALAAHRVRSGRLDFSTYRLFFGLQTMEYHRGLRQARRKLRVGHAVVVAFHAIADLGDDPLLAEYGVPRDRFAEHLDELAHHGRRFVSLEAVLRALDGEHPLPKGAVLVTFDDCYEDLLSEGCPVLAERGIPAVAFTVAGRIGESNEWDRSKGARALALLDEKGLRAIDAQGIVVGSHGMTHRSLADLEPAELKHELEGSAARLAGLGLPRPVALSYPYGVSSPGVAAAAREAGYAVAFTVEPGVVRGGENRLALPRVEVLASDTPGILRLKLATAGWPARWRQRLLRRVGARW